MLDLLTVLMSTQVSRCEPLWVKIETCLLILEVWILLFIAAARFLPQIDTIPSLMGLQSADSKLRSGYVEGYGTSAVMNCLRGCDHLLHLPLKFIFKLTCEKAQRLFDSTLWRVMSDCVQTWAARLLFCSQHAFSSLRGFSDLPLRSVLLLHLVSAVSNKEKISVSSWPANRAAINLGSVFCSQRMVGTEPDMNNKAPLHCCLFFCALVN